jgi:preprotein translocase subunit SecA
MLWMDHLDQMEHLRDSVRLRAYGQRDPLVEYKHEGAQLFRELQAAIRAQIVSTIFKVGGAPQAETPRKVEERKPAANTMFTAEAQPVPISAKKSEPEIGRNELCPCGSGKKYKKCGNLNTEEHQRNVQNRK